MGTYGDKNAGIILRNNGKLPIFYKRNLDSNIECCTIMLTEPTTPLIFMRNGMLPVKRTIKNNKFLYRQPCYGWRYFMLLLYIAHDISLVSLHAVSFEVVGCCSNLCN